MNPADSGDAQRPNSDLAAEEARIRQMMDEVEDFDDLDAAVREVRPKPYGFMFAGQKWVLPHARALGPKALTALESLDEGASTLDDLANLFRLLFGQEQAQRWNNLDPGRPEYETFFSRWMAHSGVKRGEGPASSGSSESTGGTSNPTSDASTGSASPKRSTAKRAPKKAASRRGNSSPSSAV